MIFCERRVLIFISKVTNYLKIYKGFVQRCVKQTAPIDWFSFNQYYVSLEFKGNNVTYMGQDTGENALDISPLAARLLV